MATSKLLHMTITLCEAICKSKLAPCNNRACSRHPDLGIRVCTLHAKENTRITDQSNLSPLIDLPKDILYDNIMMRLNATDKARLCCCSKQAMQHLSPLLREAQSTANKVYDLACSLQDHFTTHRLRGVLSVELSCCMLVDVTVSINNAASECSMVVYQDKQVVDAFTMTVDNKRQVLVCLAKVLTTANRELASLLDPCRFLETMTIRATHADWLEILFSESISLAPKPLDKLLASAKKIAT